VNVNILAILFICVWGVVVVCDIEKWGVCGEAQTEMDHGDQPGNLRLCSKDCPVPPNTAIWLHLLSYFFLFFIL